MDNMLILQIIIGICFTGIVVTLFLESKDYLTYSLLFLFIIGISSYFLNKDLFTDPDIADNIILAIDWNVIVFLVCLFSIVEILNDQKVFHEIALKIVNRFHNHPRKMFYALSITSTFIATIIEDLSVAIVFVPIVIEACKKMRIDPTPYLFGVTICINLASTLTPFGSAENIIIANHFGLSLHWHLIYLGIYFLVGLAITLFFLDIFVLKGYIKNFEYSQKSAIPGYFDPNEDVGMSEVHENPPMIDKMLHRATLQDIKFKYLQEGPKGGVLQQAELIQIPESAHILDIKIEKSVFRKNIVGLLIFVVVLVTISNIIIAGVLGLLLFLFLNPVEIFPGKRPEPSVSTYLHKIDAKLIYFFIILFLTVFFMGKAGLTNIIENLVESVSHHNTFVLAIGLLIITSLLSGLLDDAPITILFLPIIQDLINTGLYSDNALFIAFTLGINLGGNFLPQGAACDMMTLELARKNGVENFTYKSLTIVGGLFALLHILLGIGYIYIFTELII
ncbi:hypothetical protein NEF87_002488 [Candidatus Lokiarchaeum ossiferum]|uniref:Citrate transporter-like domain-containing protein n=1 Tax=Candidatus Lokiarchaeum ossiferum TaxID=2951803 RepID=A0ABY6HS66_9ARCH|nr:hypothetical protein NEF87_002488 [Candidatus Lokiarchaeum sp. B-35]